ncbi:MAG: histidine phosphatase family protein [Planctomycetes bacterium]|nr:histidine phosphatase family protein [Planctomycetota bacterium]
MEFLVMRHGQSKADVDHVFEGSLDAPLTERGRLDARLAAEWLAANCRARA